VLRQRVVQPQVRSEQQWRSEWNQRFMQPTMRGADEELVLEDTRPVTRHSEWAGAAEPSRSRCEGLGVRWGVRVGVVGVLALAVWAGAQLHQEQQEQQQHDIEEMEELQLVADAIASPRLGAHGENRTDYAPRNQSGAGQRESVREEASNPWADREPPADDESGSWPLLIGLLAAMGCAVYDLWQRRSAAVRRKFARQNRNELMAANAQLRGELRKLRASRDESAAEAGALRNSVVDLAAAKAELDEQLDTALSEVFRLTEEANASEVRPDFCTAADLGDLQGGRLASLERRLQVTQQKADAYKHFVTAELVPQVAETCHEIGVANERRHRAAEDCHTETARAMQMKLSPVFTPDASSPMMAGAASKKFNLEPEPEPEPEPADSIDAANPSAEEFSFGRPSPKHLVGCNTDRELASMRQQLQSAKDEVDELEDENEQLTNRIRDAEKRSAAQEATLRALRCLYDMSTRTDAFAVFKSFDTNGDGRVSRTELGTGLQKLDQGLSLSAVDVDALMSLLDTDSDGRVSYTAFTRLGTYSMYPSSRSSTHTTHTRARAQDTKKDCVSYCRSA
jgi:calcium-binding protein CML